MQNKQVEVIAKHIYLSGVVGIDVLVDYQSHNNNKTDSDI